MKKGRIILLLVLLAAVLGVTRWCIERKPATGVKSAEKEADYYYCPMHPWFHQDHPGNCGICGMTLVKKSGTGDGSQAAQPASMEGTGIPESLKGLGPISLSPWKQQLIGLRTAVAGRKPVTRIVRTVGRVAGGPDDFAAAAGDFAAGGTPSTSGKRYVVADVYALDIPYVKVGQRAWVSSLSQTGNRVEGRVEQIYPYDGTQSRVRRVKVGVPDLPLAEIFADVTIEASSQPYLAVPADAVMTTGTGQYVFVEKSPDIFVPQEVAIGFEGDGDWQITSGLSGGETVVVGANFIVDADSKLKANFAAMQAQSQ